MIEEINLASGKITTTTDPSNPSTAATADPLAQIVRVLNGHLSQLQTIDAGAAALAEKVEVAQREARSLGGGGGQQTWVEGFGRSYLGR